MGFWWGKKSLEKSRRSWSISERKLSRLGSLGLDLSGLGLGQIAGFCEVGNEYSQSINLSEFLY